MSSNININAQRIYVYFYKDGELEDKVHQRSNTKQVACQIRNGGLRVSIID